MAVRRIIKESVSPEVGPFYVIDDTVFADTEEVRDLFQNSIGVISSDNSHYDYWTVLQQIYPEFRKVDYDYYPRGRVVYSVEEDTYYLYIDECIRNKVNDIIQELGLPKVKVKVSDDEHYKCHQCNKSYVDINESTPIIRREASKSKLKESFSELDEVDRAEEL